MVWLKKRENNTRNCVNKSSVDKKKIAFLKKVA